MMLANVRGFLLGTGVGLVIDLIPHALESVLPITLCRESCGNTLRVISLWIYGLVPLCCGLIVARASVQRQYDRLMKFGIPACLFAVAVLTLALYLRQLR